MSQPVLEYSSPSTRKRVKGIPATIFSLIAAAPVVGIFVYAFLTGRMHDWGMGLIAIPFFAASTALAPLALICSLVSLRGPKDRPNLAYLGVTVSLSVTIFCLWLWIH
ncbi:MAG TPA: hypothetical protein VGG19_16570 [Tepidisphaeraceae bacterium]|jgi:hypothetical protein